MALKTPGSDPIPPDYAPGSDPIPPDAGPPPTITSSSLLGQAHAGPKYALRCTFGNAPLSMKEQGTPGWYTVNFKHIEVSVFIGGVVQMRRIGETEPGPLSLTHGSGVFCGVHFQMEHVAPSGMFELELYSSNGGERMRIDCRPANGGAEGA